MARKLFWFLVASAPALLILVLGVLDGVSDAVWDPTSFFMHAPRRVALWLISYWWVFLLFIFALHWLGFSLAPLLNRRLSAVWKRIVWAVCNFLLWPLAPPIYLWFCTNRLRCLTAPSLGGPTEVKL